jgi:pullulanase/glycogen debranching enzyme
LGPHSRTLAFYLDGRREGDEDLYVMINGDDRLCRFEIQDDNVSRWKIIVNTGQVPPDDICVEGSLRSVHDGGLELSPRSVAVLKAAASGRGPAMKPDSAG